MLGIKCIPEAFTRLSEQNSEILMHCSEMRHSYTLQLCGVFLPWDLLKCQSTRLALKAAVAMTQKSQSDPTSFSRGSLSIVYHAGSTFPNPVSLTAAMPWTDSPLPLRCCPQGPDVSSKMHPILCLQVVSSAHVATSSPV